MDGSIVMIINGLVIDFPLNTCIRFFQFSNCRWCMTRSLSKNSSDDGKARLRYLGPKTTILNSITPKRNIARYVE